jgi:hypothetical protein
MAEAHEADDNNKPAELQNGGNMTMMSRRVTLLDLVKAVQDVAGTDEEAVAVLTHMLKKNVRSVRILPEAA